jgi:transglutaminase-like putative cysteine protease
MAEKTPDPRTMTGLGLLLLGANLPLFRELPSAITLYLSALFATHLARQRFARLRFGRWLLVPLTIAAIWLVLRQFHTLFGYQAGLSLFALMLALKLLESRSERDFYVTVVLGLFFLVSQFLLDQSMYLALYALLIVLGILALLLQHNRQRPAPGRRALGFALATLLQALPLMAVLFLLFPRLGGPLWSLDLKGTSGITGLSDSMAPGSINRLIRSEEPVFRADFDGPPPEREQLYWRGPVLWRSDGFRWTRGTPATLAPPELQAFSQALRYRLILEPHNKPWVLALDLPANTPDGTRMTADFQLIADRPIDQRRQFELESVTLYNTGDLAEPELRAALQLPGNITPRMRALVAGWRAVEKDREAVVRQALDHFHREAFVYTLTPPLPGANPTDGFLFETRAGFCEHYAAAFTLLMRIAGIPSRVVTGYLGGEYNELGNYLMVRQAEAHAWSEVWLERRGWVRIDPTAAVAPERVMQEISLGDDAPGSPVSFRIEDGGLLDSTLRRLRMALDALNTRWHIWVLGYDARRQARFLGWLGLDFLEPLGIGLVMAAALALIMIALGFGLLQQRNKRSDSVTALYDLFCRRLAAVGIARAADEGPEDFARRAARARVDLKPAIRRISALYCRLRYSGRGTAEQLRELRRLVRGFRPRRRGKRQRF